ncbi:MAG: VCBS repeat-containing protein [Candidatus Eisenbacteria bacterium]|nr:VCBS repeat-containing protein [Candidatus Eisenbacteria bacterium]
MRKIASSRKLAPFVFVPLLLLAAVPALGESEGAIAVAELPAGASIATPDAAGLLHALGSAIPAASEPALPASPEPLVFPDHAGWPVSVLGGAAPPVCADLDPTSPGLETVVGTLSSGNNLYVFRQDGTPMPGWPISIGFFVAASPSIGDVDGDGEPEIVVGAWGSNEVWALHADGTPLPGWPIAVGGNVRSTAALADLDPSVDGLEIIVGVQGGTLQAWHGDGLSLIHI